MHGKHIKTKYDIYKCLIVFINKISLQEKTQNDKFKTLKGKLYNWRSKQQNQQASSERELEMSNHFSGKNVLIVAIVNDATNAALQVYCEPISAIL